MSTEATATPKYTIRELADSEYPLLAKIPPFDQMGVPDAAQSRVLVAQTPDGTVVGFWFLHAALHVEPFWLDSEHQNQHLARRMWEGIKAMMQQTPAKVAYGIIADEALVTAGMARRLGFQRIPAGLYWVSTEPIEQAAKPGNGHAAELPELPPMPGGN